MSRWALPASLAIHLSTGALLLFGLPQFPHQPEKEQAIKVDLVTPPKPPEKAASTPPQAKPPSKKPIPEKQAPPDPGNLSTADKKTPLHGPIPVLRPVFRFGEKDSGPQRSPDGESAKDASTSARTTDKAGGQRLASGHGEPRLKEARKLFSQTANGDPVATTAMRDVPRDLRIGRLCATELRAQLVNASPPYFPELLPFFPLEAGNVMDVPRSAFQAGGQWYDLGFRCEVDAAAREVVSFAFRIGKPIPHSEWKKRGLPSQ